LLIIDLNERERIISVEGPELVLVLKEKESTFFNVVLGFEKVNENKIQLRDDPRLQEKLFQLIRFLRRQAIEYKLTDSAKKNLEKRLSYIKLFNESREKGIGIQNQQNLTLSLPSEFIRSLKDYQLSSVKHMIDIPFSANFSVPGSGKTSIVLAAFSYLRKQNKVSKLFVICPRSAFDPWEEEFFNCFGRKPKSVRISGNQEERNKIFRQATNYELFTTTYQMANNEIENIFNLFINNKIFLVIDESHHIKKGPGGVWFDSILKIAQFAERKAILSGTPAPNSLEDIEAQIEIIWPGMNILKPDLLKEENIELARKALHPFYIRIKKKDLNLPEKQVYTKIIEMGSIQKKIYDAIANKMLIEWVKNYEEKKLIRDLRKAIVIRLIQAASNPTLLTEYSQDFSIPPISHIDISIDTLINNYSKFEMPNKFLDTLLLTKKILDNGKNEKIIIWTSFVNNAETISKLLSKEEINNICITGRINESENEEMDRDKLIKKFKNDSSVQALVATIPSIGESVSLHNVCHHSIYIDRTFNCGLYIQSMDRIHRIGMTKDIPVCYYLLLSENTIDWVINSRLETKMNNMFRLLDDDLDVINLDIPDDLESDWDSEDYEMVMEHLKKLSKEKD